MIKNRFYKSLLCSSTIIYALVAPVASQPPSGTPLRVLRWCRSGRWRTCSVVSLARRSTAVPVFRGHRSPLLPSSDTRVPWVGTPWRYHTLLLVHLRNPSCNLKHAHQAGCNARFLIITYLIYHLTYFWRVSLQYLGWLKKKIVFKKLFFI